MALLAEYVPERDRTGGKAEARQSQLFHAVLQLGIVLASLADSGEITFHVGCEDWHSNTAETFRHHLKGDGFARTGRARHQTVTVRHAGQQVKRVVPLG